MAFADSKWRGPGVASNWPFDQWARLLLIQLRTVSTFDRLLLNRAARESSSRSVDGGPSLMRRPNKRPRPPVERLFWGWHCLLPDCSSALPLGATVS